MSRTRRRQSTSTWEREDGKATRDKKKWYKPPKQFKKPRRQQERAKLKAALKEGKELPTIKHNDVWDWN